MQKAEGKRLCKLQSMKRWVVCFIASFNNAAGHSREVITSRNDRMLL